MNHTVKVTFAPELYIKSGIRNIDFYTHAFGAFELRCFTKDDGSIHVSALAIDGSIFHLHEETLRSELFSPKNIMEQLLLSGCLFQMWTVL